MSACTSLARSRMPHGTLTAWRTHAGTTRRAQRGTQRACGVSHAAAKACAHRGVDKADDGFHYLCRLDPFGSLLRSLQLALERRIVDNLPELGKGFGVRVHADGDGLVGCVPVVDIGTVLE